VVDSRDRDVTLFPDPAKYEVNLLEDIHDVTSLELLAADVPMMSYHVTAENRELPFEDSTRSTGAAMLELGDYASPEDMARQIQDALNALLLQLNSPGAQMRVAYVPRTDNYTFRRSGAPFSLRFDKSSQAQSNAARLLGFAPWLSYASTLDVATGDHVLRAPWRRDVTRDRYAVLHIEPAYVVHNAQTPALDKSFAIVPYDRNTINIYLDGGRRKDFKPPLARFTKVRISFLTRGGKPYDFHGRDHRLELRFTSIRQKKYTQQIYGGGQPRLVAPFEGIISEQ
jgi:hypothetical protein